MIKAKPQLFLLHFAGGNCYSFQFLKTYLEPVFEFIPLELPGRGNRMDEPLLRNKAEAVCDYVRQIEALRRREVPYMLFGHSMGATLGLVVAYQLEQNGNTPSALVVSGNPGPGVGQRKQRYLLPHDEFITELKKLGGVPDEVIDNPEVFEFFNPILRADFEIIEAAGQEVASQVDLPIVAVMGTEEEHTESISNWERFTNSSFESHLCTGNHFFIYKHADRLAGLIKKAYDKCLVL